jgi:hypothetical protein
MDLAAENNERSIIDLCDEMAVVISFQDSLASLRRRPTGCRKPGAASNGTGLETLTPAGIDVEITAHRRKRDSVNSGGQNDAGGHLHQCAGLQPLSPAGNEELILLAIHQGLMHPRSSADILKEHSAVLRQTNSRFPTDKIVALIAMDGCFSRGRTTSKTPITGRLVGIDSGQVAPVLFRTCLEGG